MSAFGWCFVGAGNIAHRVSDDTEGIRVASVCAGHFENARAFAARYGGLPCRTPEEAFAAPGVDGVYVATQHPEHMGAAVAALRAGKPVLCEKPMGVSAVQVETMIAEAKRAGKFLAEAMWPRHNPLLKQVKGWIEAGEIGEARYLHADFAESVPTDEPAYVFRLDRAGGALLDMGIYPLAIAQYIFGGAPEIIQSSGTRAESGVDQTLAALITYPGGRIASVFTALDAHSTYILTIHGTKGVIAVPDYWHAREATLTRVNGEILRAERDGCFGYGYQMRAIEAEMRAGLLQSPEMPLADTLGLAKIMDELRRQVGVTFEIDP